MWGSGSERQENLFWFGTLTSSLLLDSGSLLEIVLERGPACNLFVSAFCMEDGHCQSCSFGMKHLLLWTFYKTIWIHTMKLSISQEDIGPCEMNQSLFTQGGPTWCFWLMQLTTSPRIAVIVRTFWEHYFIFLLLYFQTFICQGKGSEHLCSLPFSASHS